MNARFREPRPCREIEPERLANAPTYPACIAAGLIISDRFQQIDIDPDVMFRCVEFRAPVGCIFATAETKRVNFTIRLTGESVVYTNGRIKSCGTPTMVSLSAGPRDDVLRRVVVVSPGSHARLLNIEIERHRFDELAQDMLGHTVLSDDGSVTRRMPAPTDIREAAEQVFQTSFSEKAQRVFVQGKALELMIRCMALLRKDEQGSGRGPVIRPSDVDRLRKVPDIIRAELRQQITLNSLARAIGMNTNKLKSGFKQTFGKSVFDYLQDTRLEVAERLIREGDMTVGQVALKVGLRNPGYFARIFKRRYGVSPARYMRDHRS